MCWQGRALNLVVFLIFVQFCRNGFWNCLFLSTENVKLTLKLLFVEACYWPESFGHLDTTMSWHGKLPSWSAASVQYTHGFPRRLVAESHRGFLPGNITVTSKASNQSLRRLAICDMAAIVSRQCIGGAGLSRARLLNLRYAALRYHSGQYCPPYLLGQEW